MATKKETNAVAVIDENTALAVVEDTGYEEYAGSGFENQTNEDYAIPFMKVLQGLSPECESIDGAKPGVILNSVTNDIYKAADGITFVPCLTQHVFVEWKPKEAGGGIVATHQLSADVVVHAKETQDFGRYKTPSGNDLIETYYVYGVLVTESGGEQAVLAFTSTKIKKYKGWMTKARSIQIAVKNAAGQVVKRVTPPLFAHRFKLTTTKEKNSKGEFWNWNIAFDGADAAACRISPKDELFVSAVALAGLVNEGKAKVDTKGADGGSEGGSGAPTGGAGNDDEVPF